MKVALAEVTILFVTILALSSIIPTALAQDYTVAYQLLNKPDGKITYKLNVVIPQTLHEYYAEKNHKAASTSDFPKFVTPYALKPVADKLWEIYGNQEDFANGALMIVHQLTYVKTTPAKYPVETMVAGQGDCDLFAYIAASIIKAGGLDVVLLYYEEQTHMNIGVHLSSTPKNARESAHYVTYEGTIYYIAECTGGNWKDGWRVGECPDDLKQVSAKVVTLENAEKIAPGQVSASFTTLQPSTLSLEVSSSITVQNGAITIRGQLAPVIPNENVTLYANINSSPWTVIGTTITQPDGCFEYTWKTDTAGLYTIRAAWVGNELYTGAISSTKSVVVLPLFLTAIIGIAAVAAVIGAVAAIITKHMKQEIIEPQWNKP